MGYLFGLAAVERVMKVQEVILRAMSGEWNWLQAADVLGISARSMRRWYRRYQDFGYDGLFDRRRQLPSPKRVPVEEVEKILRLYREEFQGFNVRHFHDLVKREYGVGLSYTFVKMALQKAGLVRKYRARGKHRLRREPRPHLGEMLHLDGSPHEWLALVPGEKQTFIQVLDDATKRVLYGQLWPGETTVAVMTALREVFITHGLPESLYTDRAGWAFHTPKAGEPVDKKRLTQVGDALRKLGVEHIPAYSPQARGRSERLNRTFQGRLVNELRRGGVQTLEAANVYLRDHFIPAYNDRFTRVPKLPESKFMVVGDIDWESIFCDEEERTVNKDNTVAIDGLYLQIVKQPGRATCAGIKVHVRRQMDGTYSIWRAHQNLGYYSHTGLSLPLPRGRGRESAPESEGLHKTGTNN